MSARSIRRGRPKKGQEKGGRSPLVSARLHPEHVDHLDRMARDRGLSRAALTRMIIEEALNREARGELHLGSEAA